MSSFVRKLLSKSKFGHFFLSYAITEAITIGLYTGIYLFIAPIFLASIIQYHEENADTYAHGQDPINIAIYIFAFVVFYVVLSVVYLYRNKERRLQYYKSTVEDSRQKQRIRFYMTEYGLSDIVYYCIISIPVRLILRGNFESMILFWDMPIAVHYILSYLLFAVMYTCCVMVVTSIWEKKRPIYLTKGYEEKSDEISDKRCCD